MAFQSCELESFAVIGKEGSTLEGEGFIQRLWTQANRDFWQVEPLALRKGEEPVGFWGVMSDFSRSFAPWTEDFTQGIYLAGVQVPLEAQPPEGWIRWQVPAFRYMYAATRGDYQETFRAGLAYIRENGLQLAGAVQEYTCPQEEQLYLFFPIARL